MQLRFTNYRSRWRDALLCDRRVLSGKAVSRSRRSIRALLDIQPEYANLKENGTTRQVRPDEVAVGQTIVVKPGERVPLDGEVVAGTSLVDTSALTGESTPRKMEAGATILAGMVNGEGLLTVKVTRPYQDSSVARILHLVEEAGERKAPTEQFITVLPGTIPLGCGRGGADRGGATLFIRARPSAPGSTGPWSYWSSPVLVR